jgi:L-arabonate dehydrase
MAEVGNMALPAKILKKGIEDMVRISDARMSGTAFGTVVLHVSPEAALGGNISHVRDGDMITLDVDARTLSVDISDEELEKRRELWTPPMPPNSGYARLFHDHIEGMWIAKCFCLHFAVLRKSRSHIDDHSNAIIGPELGADFDFLKGCRGAAIPKESH